MGGRGIAVRNKACTLMMVVMKGRNGVGAAACKAPRRQADKGMGVMESFIIIHH